MSLKKTIRSLQEFSPVIGVRTAKDVLGTKKNAKRLMKGEFEIK